MGSEHEARKAQIVKIICILPCVVLLRTKKGGQGGKCTQRLCRSEGEVQWLRRRTCLPACMRTRDRHECARAKMTAPPHR